MKFSTYHQWLIKESHSIFKIGITPFVKNFLGDFSYFSLPEKKIYSKDIAFDQCRKFLANFGLDEVELIPVESTTKAAKLAANEPNSAAICAHVAAKLYNLPILFENIEDKDNNKTRFFILSDFENSPSGNDKTSILVNLPIAGS